MHSQYMFGTGPGHLSHTILEAAEAAGGTLNNYTDPRGEKSHWFVCPNTHQRDEVEKRVMAAARAAAVTKADRRGLRC